MIRINNSIGYVLDVDASKVIEAVRSTGVTITPAMMHYAHYLISNMKNIGTWQLSNAVYGFVGGTAGSHKFNWKDLRDVDAAYRLSFVGGITHNSNGMQSNGTTGYANTYISGSVDIPLNSNFIGFYSSTSGLVSGNAIGYSGSNQLACGFNPVNLGVNNMQASGNNAPGTVNSSKGFRLNYRTSSSVFKHIVNDKILSFSATATNREAVNLFICALSNNFNSPISFTTAVLPFAIVGNQVLTDIQAIQQSQIVTNAQAILNRL